MLILIEMLCLDRLGGMSRAMRTHGLLMAVIEFSSEVTVVTVVYRLWWGG